MKHELLTWIATGTSRRTGQLNKDDPMGGMGGMGDMMGGMGGMGM